jgi:beta-lactamase class A
VNKRLSLFFYVTVAFVTGIVVANVHDNRTEDLRTTFTETRSQGNYKFINPLLECDSANFEQDNNLYNLKTKIETVIKIHSDNGDSSFTSVYYRDLNNGPWIGIDEKEDFSPSSLIKVPLMIVYYKMAETDPSILQKTLKYSEPYDYNNQNFQPQITIVPEQEYTIEQLIESMIIYSDNAAYTLLSNNLDAQVIIKTYNDLGVDISKGLSNPSGNILSVKAYASFFRILYNASYLSPIMSEKALNLLSQVKFKQGINAGVSSSLTVAHKFGERQYLDTKQKQLHDCGIVYLPGKPYLICIMTRGNDFTRLTAVIKDISSVIYKHFPAAN